MIQELQWVRCDRNCTLQWALEQTAWCVLAVNQNPSGLMLQCITPMHNPHYKMAIVQITSRDTSPSLSHTYLI